MANDFKFGNKTIKDLFFGNKAVTAIYFGANLVWQKIKKILQFGNNELIGIEFIPDNDIILNSISIFQNDTNANGWTWICHESGFCVARQTSNGTSPNTELYGLTGTLKTISSLGSIKLYQGQKYYIFYKQNQWDSTGSQFAYYQGQTGNYKVGGIDGNITVSTKGETIDDTTYLYTDQTKFPYKGTFGLDTSDSNTVKTFLLNKGLTKRSTFTWNGAYCGEPSLDGPNNQQTYIVNTNLTNVITITQEELNDYSTSVQKYAYVMMRAGTNVGRCIRYMHTNSIQWESIDMFGGPDKLYEIQWPMYNNKITSMTPVTFAAPSNPNDYDTYYKASGVDWGGITDEAVVIWVNGNWVKATNWTADFTKYDWGNSGIIRKITTEYLENQTLKFTVNNDKKYYLRINGNEV